MDQKRLLILACSATKIPTPGELPAVDRYRPGAYYQMLHRAPRDHWPDIIILSARYGFIAGDQPIPDYDTCMSRQLAESFKADPVTRDTLKALIHPLGYQDIFIAAGKTYRDVIESTANLFPPEAIITTAKGGIGQQRSQLKAWLSRTTTRKETPC